MMLLAFILLNLLSTFAKANVRQRRYLVYPDGGPARAQFIIGVGVPVDLKEASVTVGTVIKFQYDLPTNSSEYTSRIYGFANTVSRDMDGDGKEDDEKEIDDHKGNELLENDNDNDTLVDITFDDRRKRSIMFSEGGSINNIDVSKTNQISLEEAIRRQEMIDQKHKDETEPQRMNRWDFYKIIEHMAERYGYSGRPCLLRTICEAAEVPFTHENGLLGEIGHIIFTPSTTKDPVSHHTDTEYHAAERLGREAEQDCESFFPECESSVLETFTEIGMDTLHKFGLM
ncbi:PREDICTED: uncharacterized protein LOC106111581 [Papilio polytes]|uniref:uncharacterized protein LOC106111581 n=1 Tax=Papilio polytes TaxID=76194 RepID=UPI0006765218|nr:PREDICTED: uncharacterized protein LOC106111581 [Papilio polytes]